MIKIENVEVVGLEHAIWGMRNPKNSWDRSDSVNCAHCGTFYTDCPDNCPVIKVGPNDHKLMMDLAAGGPVHAKYRRMIVVYMDITAPLYMWKEFDTYKVGTVANSCSTMHKIHAKEFTLDDFSHEHLLSWEDEPDIPGCGYDAMTLLEDIVDTLESYRKHYIYTDNELKRKDLTEDERARLVERRKLLWWQMIQLLPSSYNQKRTVMLNYEVLVGIYKWRKNHKLDEWREFCSWIESLPYSELITGKEKNDDK